MILPARTTFGLVASAVFLAGAAIAADPATSTPSAAATASQSTSMAMHHEMMAGMHQMHGMKPSGDADQDFAHMMEHHHAQGLKMTEAYLKGAKNAELKAWAEKTLKSQQKELDELKKIQGTMTPAPAGT